MLIEEFSKAGVAFPEDGTSFVDVLKIERLVNSHTLGNTYKRYTGEELEGAHDALADVRATLTIFQKQLEGNAELPKEPAEIDAHCQGENKRVDYAGKLYKKDEKVYWNFGKHRDELVSKTASYARWVINNDFPEDTKRRLREVIGE